MVDNLRLLGLEEGECPLLVPTERQVVILEEKNINLEARKSRYILKGGEGLYCGVEGGLYLFVIMFRYFNLLIFFILILPSYFVYYKTHI